LKFTEAHKQAKLEFNNVAKLRKLKVRDLQEQAKLSLDHGQR